MSVTVIPRGFKSYITSKLSPIQVDEHIQSKGNTGKAQIGLPGFPWEGKDGAQRK